MRWVCDRDERNTINIGIFLPFCIHHVPQRGVKLIRLSLSKHTAGSRREKKIVHPCRNSTTCEPAILVWHSASTSIMETTNGVKELKLGCR